MIHAGDDGPGAARDGLDRRAAEHPGGELAVRVDRDAVRGKHDEQRLGLGIPPVQAVGIVLGMQRSTPARETIGRAACKHARSQARLSARRTRSGGALADIDLLSYISHVRFEWDPKKAVGNLKKHGVSFGEAQTAFDDELGAYYPDSLHADRFILVGFSHQHRLLYVVHAEVTAEVIRIISARKATRHEKAHYEND